MGSLLDVLEVRRRQLSFASATLLARLGDEGDKGASALFHCNIISEMI